MDTVKVSILNPKAKRLLKDLAELNLISIRDVSKGGFSKLLNKLRSKDGAQLSLDEITSEVEIVRSKRYGKKSN